MSQGAELLKEMQNRNPERLKQYLNKYTRFSGKKGSPQGFIEDFEDYVAQQPVGKDGYKVVSLFSFERFLLKKHNGIDVLKLFGEDS